jgi:hypothetical protein
MDTTLKEKLATYLLSITKILEQITLAIGAEHDKEIDEHNRKERAWKHGKIY